jgi:hypothetical protein
MQEIRTDPRVRAIGLSPVPVWHARARLSSNASRRCAGLTSQQIPAAKQARRLLHEGCKQPMTKRRKMRDALVIATLVMLLAMLISMIVLPRAAKAQVADNSLPQPAGMQTAAE